MALLILADISSPITLVDLEKSDVSIHYWGPDTDPSHIPYSPLRSRTLILLLSIKKKKNLWFT